MTSSLYINYLPKHWLCVFSHVIHYIVNVMPMLFFLFSSAGCWRIVKLIGTVWCPKWLAKGLKLRCVYLQSDIWYNLEFFSRKKNLNLKMQLYEINLTWWFLKVKAVWVTLISSPLHTLFFGYSRTINSLSSPLHRIFLFCATNTAFVV